MKRNRFLYFLIFLLFVISMQLWIGWSGNDRMFEIAISICMILLGVAGKYKFKWEKRDVVGLLFLYIALGHSTVFFSFGTFVRLLPFLFILGLKEGHRIECIDFITKFFAILMIPSIIVYWLVQMHLVPHFGIIEYGNEIVNRDYALRENYIFYAYSQNFYDIRFNGPFLEPGHLGMMSAFLLFINKFNLRNKYNVIILLALLHTFSLAGYVLAFMAFLLMRYYEGKLRLKRLLVYCISFLAIIVFANTYNGGDNFLNELILERLQLDEEKGFSGNNRSGEIMALYAASMFEDINTLLWGVDSKTWEYILGDGTGGSGFTKNYVHYGLIGILILTGFYVYYASHCKNRKFALLLFVFFVCLYWQRCYSLWYSWVICFAYGISKFENEQQLIKKDKYDKSIS